MPIDVGESTPMISNLLSQPRLEGLKVVESDVKGFTRIIPSTQNVHSVFREALAVPDFHRNEKVLQKTRSEIESTVALEAWGENFEFQNYELKCREVKIDNLKMELEKVVKERDKLKVKIEKWEESYKGRNKLLNSQMSAKDKNGLGYGKQLDEMSNKSEINSEISMSVFEVRSSNEEITPANDSFSKEDGYHAVPPPITGNFLTPRADISFAGLDEYAIRKKIIESKQSELKMILTIGIKAMWLMISRIYKVFGIVFLMKKK
ncbi:hypothetical protein Tco_0170081 [Tanacetum coccineum]